MPQKKFAFIPKKIENQAWFFEILIYNDWKS